jgi:enamine deaminase RidA (YjgF/YER057c/UK114 family)
VPDGPPTTSATARRDVVRAPGLADVGITHATRVDEYIYVAGQLALDEHGVLVGPGDCRTQANQCLRNIECALTALGASRGDIVKLVCYLKSTADIDAYLAAKADFFVWPTPASTTVVVSDLLVAGALLEVEAIAVSGSQPSEPLEPPI